MTDFFSLKQPKMTPGKVLRAFRKNFGFTLEDIEKLTGIRVPNLSAMEGDKRPVGQGMAIRLAAIYGLDPGLILFPNGTEVLDLPEYRKIQRSAERLRTRKLAVG